MSGLLEDSQTHKCPRRISCEAFRCRCANRMYNHFQKDCHGLDSQCHRTTRSSPSSKGSKTLGICLDRLESAWTENVEGSNEIPESHAWDEPLHVVRFSTLSWYRHPRLTSLSSGFLLLLIFASLPSMRDIRHARGRSRQTHRGRDYPRD